MRKIAFLFIAFLTVYSCQSDIDTVVDQSSTTLRSATTEKNEIFINWSLAKYSSTDVRLTWYVNNMSGINYNSLELIRNFSIGASTNIGGINFDSWRPEMPWPEPADVVGGDGYFNVYVKNFNIQTNTHLPFSATIKIPIEVLDGVEWIQLNGSDFEVGALTAVIGWGSGYNIGDQLIYEFETDLQQYYCEMDQSKIYL